MHPGQKLGPGARVIFEGARAASRRGARAPISTAAAPIRLWTDDGAIGRRRVDAIGHVPLPPYIKRDDRADDRERYQTVFARERGSVAAPTAGLHFTPALFAALAARGVEIAEITLHVGYGTFQPVRVDRVEDHRLERRALRRSARRRRGHQPRARRRPSRRRRRHDDDADARGGGAGARRPLVAGTGTTDLFIYPGFPFRVVERLLTNFHLPRSSLLMLVSAFAGPRARAGAYRRRSRSGYRFYSYGDAMLIT